MAWHFDSILSSCCSCILGIHVECRQTSGNSCGLAQRFVPGFDHALESLKSLLPDGEVPSPESFFPSSLTEDEPPQVSHLSRKLLRAQPEKLHKELYDVATGPEIAFLTVTSHKTCGDFLFVPLTDQYCRMARTFKTFTRLYLGLKVTSKACNIGECNGTDVHPFGAHGYHAPGKITNRHHAIRDCISSFISFQTTAHNTPHEVRKEVFLDDVAYEQLPTAKDESRARCDFMITKQESNYRVFADICLVHPNVTDKDTATKKLKTAYAAEELKFKRYCDNYHVQKAQIKPLVFEMFGGWTENTYEYLY